MSAYDAAMTAAKERLRPIVMTSLAFILGCVPLAIAVGASENSRHSIGTGVIGGMLAATVIAIFFIPLFYYLVERMFGERTTPKQPPSQLLRRRLRRFPTVRHKTDMRGLRCVSLLSR